MTSQEQTALLDPSNQATTGQEQSALLAVTLPTRLRLSRGPGQHLRRDHPDYINVGRPAKSRFANPFTVGIAADVRTNTEAVELYRGWLLGDPATIRYGLDPDRLARRGWTGAEPWLQLHGPALVAAVRAELPGRPLACWCKLDEPCHADVLRIVTAGGEV